MNTDANGRRPTMAESLQVLLDHGVDVNGVLDVGILTGTAPLIKVFNDRYHHLFEPVNLHFDQIQRNYRNVDHTLHHVALSSEDGVAYLSCRSIHRDGKITHAEVVPEPTDASTVEGFVKCEQIPKSRLDTIMESQADAAPYLLKIDVDGHEMPILHGAEQTLKQCSVVVIEAPLNRVPMPLFFERALFLMESGFRLMDIVDFAYYDGILWQVDLVFVREDYVESIPELKPFQHPQFRFSGEKWFPLTDRLYRN